MPVFEVVISFEEKYLLEADNFDDAYYYAKDDWDNGLSPSRSEFDLNVFETNKTVNNDTIKVPSNYFEEG